jgi:formate hydrogenlyase transcriptional activator
VIPHDAAALALYDPAAGDLAVQFLGRTTDVFPAMRAPSDRRHDIRPVVFRTREPVLAESDRTLTTPGDRAQPHQLGMQSGCWVPLSITAKAIGPGGGSAGWRRIYGRRKRRCWSQIAVQVAMAVDNAMAFRRIAELRDKLRQEKQYLEEGDQPRAPL